MIETVALDQLVPWPGNPRRGNVDAIAESLAVHGPYQPVIVQRSTMRIVGGNHTVEAARRLGWHDFPVRYVDVDDRTAHRMMLADNGTADLAGYDDAGLLALLDEFQGDLTGTGWDPGDVEHLRELVEAPLDLQLPDQATPEARGGGKSDDTPKGPHIDVSRLDAPILLTDAEAGRVVDTIEQAPGKPEDVIRARLRLPARPGAARRRQSAPPVHDVTEDRVPIDSIAAHPDNPRQGDVGAIAESLAEFGQYRPVVVQRSTGLIIAGTHRWYALRQLGAREVDVVFRDVDDDEARRILVVDNRTSDLGRYDDQAFAAALQAADSFAGTTYSYEDLDVAMARVEQGLPSKKARVRVVVPERKAKWRVEVPWRVYDPWWTELLGACGEDPDAVRAEILTRLT